MNIAGVLSMLSFLSAGVLSALIMVSWIPLMIASFRFGSYLKRHNYSRWKELTHIEGLLGSGFANPFKAFPYLRSQLDNEDKTIADFKNGIRRQLRLFSRLLIAIAVLIAAALLLAILEKTQ